MSATISDQVRGLASDLFMLPLEDIQPSSSPKTIEAWDSVQHLNLTLDLEMTFGVKFTPEEIQGMTNIASVISTVEHKLATTAGA
jgi:acyl carrier protein